MKNTGSSPLPYLSLSTTFYKNGTSVGQWAVDTTSASPVGAETTVYGPSLSETTPTAIKVLLDASNRLAETREDNNVATATLQCGGAGLNISPITVR